MSRADLDQIQAQLKVSIQSHQTLVAKMKNDPQNVVLQKQLHELQAQITGLSDRQKSIVQQLRKELLQKQHFGSAKVSQSQSHPTNLSTKAPSAANVLANSHNNNIAPGPAAKTTAHPAPAPAKPLVHPAATAVKEAAAGDRTSATGSPPIRVPHYSAHRPAAPKITASHHKGNYMKPLTQGSSNAPTSGSMRKHSDSDLLYNVKRTSIEGKGLSEEQRKKLEYMASLDLVTPNTLKELQNKRSERKRRSTANPQFSYGHFEPERKRRVVNYMASILPNGDIKRKGRPPKACRQRSVPPAKTLISPTELESTASVSVPESTAKPSSGVIGSSQSSTDNDVHEDYCAICHRSGELLMCDTCNLVYHLACMDPPLTTIPTGSWSCQKCQVLTKQMGNNNWPGTLALVHSYITQKTAKEEEKKKNMCWGEELKEETMQLENKSKQLGETISQQLVQKTELLNNNHVAQQNVDKLKNFINFFNS